MSYFFKFVWRAFSKKSTWQPPRRQKPIMVPNNQSTFKKPALSEAGIRAGIEGFPRSKVRHVIDGDTVVVEKGWNSITIRLDCIDCPEDGQPWGDTATFGLIKLIGGRHVHIEEHGLDCYGRTLATIFVRDARGSEWINVNERMIMLGHAWVMRHFYDHLPQDRKDKLNRLEHWAKTKRVGLWRTSNPLPPWEWRPQNHLPRND